MYFCVNPDKLIAQKQGLSISLVVSFLLTTKIAIFAHSKITMLDKLEAIKARFDQVGVALTNPEIINNQSEFGNTVRNIVL